MKIEDDTAAQDAGKKAPSIRGAIPDSSSMASSRRRPRHAARRRIRRADFDKPQVGIASTWSNLTPCNMHIDELARVAAAGVEAPAPRR